ncbi:unnamed protein product, partial [Mesorhabditis spiculigera]
MTIDIEKHISDKTNAYNNMHQDRRAVVAAQAELEAKESLLVLVEDRVCRLAVAEQQLALQTWRAAYANAYIAGHPFEEPPCAEFSDQYDLGDGLPALINGFDKAKFNTYLEMDILELEKVAKELQGIVIPAAQKAVLAATAKRTESEKLYNLIAIRTRAIGVAAAATTSALRAKCASEASFTPVKGVAILTKKESVYDEPSDGSVVVTDSKKNGHERSTSATAREAAATPSLLPSSPRSDSSDFDAVSSSSSRIWIPPRHLHATRPRLVEESIHLFVDDVGEGWNKGSSSTSSAPSSPPSSSSRGSSWSSARSPAFTDSFETSLLTVSLLDESSEMMTAVPATPTQPPADEDFQPFYSAVKEEIFTKLCDVARRESIVRARGGQPTLVKGTCVNCPPEIGQQMVTKFYGPALCTPCAKSYTQASRTYLSKIENHEDHPARVPCTVCNFEKKWPPLGFSAYQKKKKN